MNKHQIIPAILAGILCIQASGISVSAAVRPQAKYYDGVAYNQKTDFISDLIGTRKFGCARDWAENAPSADGMARYCVPVISENGTYMLVYGKQADGKSTMTLQHDLAGLSFVASTDSETGKRAVDYLSEYVKSDEESGVLRSVTDQATGVETIYLSDENVGIRCADPAAMKKAKEAWAWSIYDELTNWSSTFTVQAVSKPGSDDITVTLPSESSPYYGTRDVTGDYTLDAADAQFVLQAYADTLAGNQTVLTDAQQIEADVNRDGKIDSVDAQVILMYYTDHTITLINTSWYSLIG